MKIIIAKDGKKKISLTKSEWKSMGKKAGWEEETTKLDKFKKKAITAPSQAPSSQQNGGQQMVPAIAKILETYVDQGFQRGNMRRDNNGNPTWQIDLSSCEDNDVKRYLFNASNDDELFKQSENVVKTAAQQVADAYKKAGWQDVQFRTWGSIVYFTFVQGQQQAQPEQQAQQQAQPA